jgi:hypothetical protein
MGRLIFWVVTAIAVSVLFLGVRAAAGLTTTIAGTGGSTGGLIIGGIPTFVGSFKNGLSGGGGAPGGAGAGASWQGGITQFGVPQAPAPAPRQAPAKQKTGSGKAGV